MHNAKKHYIRKKRIKKKNEFLSVVGKWCIYIYIYTHQILHSRHQSQLRGTPSENLHHTTVIYYKWYWLDLTVFLELLGMGYFWREEHIQCPPPTGGERVTDLLCEYCPVQQYLPSASHKSIKLVNSTNLVWDNCCKKYSPTPAEVLIEKGWLTLWTAKQRFLVSTTTGKSWWSLALNWL